MTASGGEPGGRVLVPGRGEGDMLVLDAPLSLWGGLDIAGGAIIDRRHPQCGEVVTERVLVMPSGRGSSSSSTVLAEAIRLATAPAALVLAEPDGILALGALVAAELYGRACPVLQLDRPHYATLHTGMRAAVAVSARAQRFRFTLRDGGASFTD